MPNYRVYRVIPSKIETTVDLRQQLWECDTMEQANQEISRCQAVTGDLSFAINYIVEEM